ncbi:MAG: FHA domain-containing protein [Deltaproteobacteria bacterium]|nr:FHA domain-containing protein [Deltaproteobacteria bacterium]
MPFLEIFIPGLPPRRFDLGAQPVTIGRGEGNAVVIEHEGVSRHHCTIVLERDRYVVIDAGGRNGVHVNGVRLQKGLLAEGANIQLGAVAIRFRDIGAAETVGFAPPPDTVGFAPRPEAVGFVPPPEAAGFDPPPEARPAPPPRRVRLLWPLIGVAVLLATLVTLDLTVWSGSEKPTTAGSPAPATTPVGSAAPAVTAAGSAATPAATAASLPAAWRGSLCCNRDFEMTDPSERDGIVRYRYRAWDRGSTATAEEGVMGVVAHGRKVDMMLVTASDQPVRRYDGIVAADGRLALGDAYPPDAKPSEHARKWWATIDAAPPQKSARPDLDHDSVGVLALWLSRRSDAWIVVERRLLQGPFKSVADVRALEIDAQSMTELGGADVR